MKFSVRVEPATLGTSGEMFEIEADDIIDAYAKARPLAKGRRVLVIASTIQHYKPSQLPTVSNGMGHSV